MWRWDYWRYSRKEYWIWVVALLLLKLCAIVAMQLNPKFLSFAGLIDAAIGGGLMWVVGGRFGDAGGPRWLGFGLVALIFEVSARSGLRTGIIPFDVTPSQTALMTGALLALLIAAGVPRGVDAALPERPQPTI
jgi:uncharacterized membrane protein YhaH (DUF805 family)